MNNKQSCNLSNAKMPVIQNNKKWINQGKLRRTGTGFENFETSLHIFMMWERVCHFIFPKLVYLRKKLGDESFLDGCGGVSS